MTDANSNDRMRSILVMLATASTIAFNLLAALGYVNGVTPAEISARYPTVITPAGYAFSIWSLVYLGLFIFSVYQLLPANLARFGGVRTLYIASCVLNCGWVYFWHQDRVGICAIIILVLAVILVAIAARFQTAVTLVEAWAVKGTFGLYAGWVAVASIVNVLVYLRSIDSSLAVSASIGVAAVVVATGLAVAATWKLSNHFFPLAVAWALTAIAVKQSGNTPIVIACAGGVILSLLVAISFILTLPSSSTLDRAHE